MFMVGVLVAAKGQLFEIELPPFALSVSLYPPMGQLVVLCRVLDSLSSFVGESQVE